MTASPIATGFRGAARRMQPGDVTEAAERIGCDEASIRAVLDVESSGSGFDGAGRPKILFEPHIFYRQLADKPDTLQAAIKQTLAYKYQGTFPYPPTSDANYARLIAACALDPDAAMRSASWGIAQVMGFNAGVGGYSDVSAMVLACMDSEAAQFGLLLGYVEHNGLVAALRQRDWRMFATRYNGTGQVAAYAAKLAAAYAHHCGPEPVLETRQNGKTVQLVTPIADILRIPPAFDRPALTTDQLNNNEWLQLRQGAAA